MGERSPSPDWANTSSGADNTSSPAAKADAALPVTGTVIAVSPGESKTVKESKGPDPKQEDKVVAAEILKSIFGEVGELISDYTCAIESNILLHGRMYVTSKFICFYSNLFGLEKKIRIPYHHITSITKEMTAVVIPNAISVTTQRKNYIFRSFWDRDDCFNTVSALLQRHRDSAAGRDSAASMPGDERGRSGSVLSSDSAGVSPAPVAARPKSMGDTEIESVQGRRELDATAAPSGEEAPPAADVQVTAEDYAKMLKEEVEKSKLKLPVCSEKLKTTVDKFEKMFILENAPHGYLAYHKLMKDENIDPSGWSEEATSLGHAREIKFLKVVNLPGLATTRAKKLQRYRRFGDAGMIVCSSTSMEDVPSADTFSVEDMVVVTDLGNGEVMVDMSMEVKFVKSTMFKRLIESNTNSEVVKWLQDFMKYLQKTVEEPATEGKKEGKKKKEKKSIHVQPPAPPPKLGILETLNHELNNIDFAGNKVFWVVWILLMVTMLFFGIQWKSVNETLHKQNVDIETLIRLTQKLTESNTEIMAFMSKKVNN